MKTFSSLQNILRKISRPRIFLLTMITVATAAGFGFVGSKETSGDEYVAHEWGTFTSVQASDGVLLNWQAVAPVELPGFVYNWARPGLNRVAVPDFSKSFLMALQRMETPVIYFYGDEAQKVDVTVRFPKGKITEWYPQAKDIGPSLPRLATNQSSKNFLAGYGVAPSTNGTKESLIRWNLDILPSRQTSPVTLPVEKSGNHYFAARETDAAILRVNPTESDPLPNEYEKFLFYRGVGNFGTPLKVTMSASGEITLANTSKETLKHLFILGVDDGAGKFVHVAKIPAGEQKTLRLDVQKQKVPLQKLVPQVSSALAKALTDQGLYQRESDAMVKTWKDSWFQEEGLRVLYVLPRAWTDQTLPIDFTPAPRDLVRVMVGRAELITPDFENK
ncbi:MAG: hypothetical protein ABIP71_09910, partial [Verrucomicrobiota bacterium]